jgi:phosphatidate cytidylyltransferase
MQSKAAGEWYKSMNPELKKRILTGVGGGIGILVILAIAGHIGAALLAALLSIGMVYEFVEMTFTLPDKTEKRFVLMGTAWLVAFVNFWVPRAEYELLLIVFIGLFVYFLFTADRHAEILREHFTELVYALFGSLYVIFLPLFFPLIREYTNGFNWTILFLLIVWSGDTGAYFVGRKYGKKKLYPLISPKKTLEGAGGGLAAGFVITLLYKLIFFRAMSWGGVLITPIFVGIAAQVGDFCESFLKRAYDKKDSGHILPGHGGFLDRFDGIVFSLPVMYGCMRIFG